MKPPEFKYFKVRTKPNDTQIEFTSLHDFHRYVTEQHSKVILVLQNEQQESTHFAITHHGLLMMQATLAFQSLEDYLHSVQHHFPDAASYYDALQQGYQQYEDYKLVKEAGIADKKLFDKIKSGGFVDGYPVFMQWQQSNPALLQTGSLAHPYALYQYALAKGFEQFSKLKKAIENGFVDAATFDIATEKGFVLASDYQDALKRGCNNLLDLELFREQNIRDKDDFRLYLDLVFLNKTGCKHDECVLLILLSKLDVGKKISINKLNDYYKKAIEDYRYKDTNEMPPWFTKGFSNLDDIVSFLSKNELVKKYGNYHTDGEFFETNRMQERKVVIDGSNVAYNSNGNAKSEAKVSNIMAMIVFLKNKGFAEITVINDASLRHRVMDKNNLPELKKMAECIEAPAETPADIFIIHYVKRNHCLLVSNDTYREWKTQDPWVAENIDFYRLSFLIHGNTVLMPDIDR